MPLLSKCFPCFKFKREEVIDKLDYSNTPLQDAFPEVWQHERTLEELHLSNARVSNKLPKSNSSFNFISSNAHPTLAANTSPAAVLLSGITHPAGEQQQSGEHTTSHWFAASTAASGSQSES